MKINTFQNLPLHYEFITKIASIVSRLSPMAFDFVYTRIGKVQFNDTHTTWCILPKALNIIFTNSLVYVNIRHHELSFYRIQFGEQNNLTAQGKKKKEEEEAINTVRS